MTVVRISDAIEQILIALRTRGDVTVDDCLGLLRDESILMAILCLALLNVLPFGGIPGFSSVTGAPIVLLGLQLVAGSRTLWMPRRIRERPVSGGRLSSRLEAALPRLRRAEKVLKPRGVACSMPPLRNVLGIVITGLAVLLTLPIPLSNFVLGFSIAVLAIGLIARDAVVIALGLCAAAGAVTAVTFAFHAIGTGFDMMF